VRQGVRYFNVYRLFTTLLLCAAGAANGAELEVRCGAKALNVWDDAGSGSPHHVTFYFASAQDDYYPVGVTADNQQSGKRSALCLVRDISPNGNALKPPVDYVRIWWDRASGARRDGAIWRPECPKNYEGIGFMVQANYRKPALDAIRCVHKDLLVSGTALKVEGEKQLAGAVYADYGTLAIEDLSIWRVKAKNGLDVSAVFALATRDIPKEGHGVFLLDENKLRVNK
jgi:hypothetical protein